MPKLTELKNLPLRYSTNKSRVIEQRSTSGKISYFVNHDNKFTEIITRALNKIAQIFGAKTLSEKNLSATLKFIATKLVEVDKKSKHVSSAELKIIQENLDIIDNDPKFGLYLESASGQNDRNLLNIIRDKVKVQQAQHEDVAKFRTEIYSLYHTVTNHGFPKCSQEALQKLKRKLTTLEQNTKMLSYIKTNLPNDEIIEVLKVTGNIINEKMNKTDNKPESKNSNNKRKSLEKIFLENKETIIKECIETLESGISYNQIKEKIEKFWEKVTSDVNYPPKKKRFIGLFIHPDKFQTDKELFVIANIFFKHFNNDLSNLQYTQLL